jgi:queuine tRNA-ribosyltransferase
MMQEIRGAIAAGTFAELYRERRVQLAETDRDNPHVLPVPRRNKATTRGAFGLHTSPHGFTSIQHLPSGEIMHSVNAPDDEAEAVYVRQSIHIAAALAGERPLVVWDVGLGAAHNAMALIRALDARVAHAAVELVSFERDLDALRLALANTGPFAHLRHPAPNILAHRGRFERDGLTWQLLEGDFLERYRDAAQPDVIFYDPFSAKVDGPLWSLATFRALRAHLTGAVELITYTNSTAIRSSLLAAGFHVARGVATGPKEETTIALTVPQAGHALLGRDWLERRARSSAPVAHDVTDPAEVDRAIRNHPQFV